MACMLVGQNKFIGTVTDRVLNIANNKIDFTKYNYCMKCKQLYPKDIDYCIRCQTKNNRPLKLKTEHTTFIKCNQCGAKLHYDDLYCSRKRKSAHKRYTCIPCGLQFGFITVTDLQTFMQRNNIDKKELTIICKK